MTKLHAPAGRAHTLARDRLVERLRAGAETKVTLVAAPAGYGKSTLLGTWCEAEKVTRPVAWLSLDEGENDPVVLWSYVLAALRGECPTLGVTASPESVGASRIVDAFLPELVNALTALGDAALVLDDFHRLTSGLARDTVAWFISSVPSTFQLVVATRSEPALPLAALRAHGELLELRADDLGFTPAEAEVLLNDRLELGLEPEDVQDLVERTEGWPAGLYLAALSLGGVDDRHAFVRRFGGESRYIVDFLVDEVLQAHEPAMQTLMLRSSVLERLCGSLCDAVVEQEGSDELLAALSRTNLFLLPLDDRGEWYRFHHLFAQLLRVELEHREPGLVSTLHWRALTWHRDNGLVGQAIEHALKADAFAEAGDLIVTTWMDYVNAGRQATLLAWLARFPRESLRNDPRALVVEAWVLSLCGEREAADDAIAALDRLRPLDQGPLPDGFSSLEASVATLRGTIAWGDFGAALENARRAAELEGPTSQWRSLVCLALGMCLYFSGQLDEADRWLAQSPELALAQRHWRVAAQALACRSLVAGELGRVDEQALFAGEAVKLAQERGIFGVDAEVFTALGASLEEQGKLDEALSSFGQAAAIERRWGGHPGSLADALIRQAALLQALDRPEAAAAVIEEARATVDSCADPGILAQRLVALHRPRRRNSSGTLSERELVILRMLTSRLSERDIGRELYLSHNTIHSHTRSIYRKLDASSRSEALKNARVLGLI